MVNSPRTLIARSALILAGAVLCVSGAADAPGGFGVCVPRGQRAGQEVGCFIVTDQAVGPLGSKPVYWHIARFASRALAEQARPKGATVMEAYGSAWLMTIGDADRRLREGREVAMIGPLPVTPGKAYSALYMEASMRPGMKSAVHRHSGPEAWYTLSGETCLETPQGTQVGRAGGPPVIVAPGLPMELTATGTTVRKSLVLILHDAAQRPTTTETAWKPRGLCR